MRKDKRTRLEAKGWKFGSAKDFLGLSEEESAYIELKFGLQKPCVNAGKTKACLKWISPRSSGQANRASPRWKQATPRFPWTCSPAPSSRSEPRTANSPRSSRPHALHKTVLRHNGFMRYRVGFTGLVRCPTFACLHRPNPVHLRIGFVQIFKDHFHQPQLFDVR